MLHYDVVIAGGGPAGSAVGSLIKRYSPHLKVLLLEKAQFPRHHVGESMLAGATPVLHDMGVFDKIDKHGFVEKLGATYIWGRDREPWGFEFDELLKKLTLQGEPLPRLYYKAWQVRRAEYDHILLNHTAEWGVEVHQGARVTRILREQNGERVTGVEYQDQQGTHTVASTWLIDCTGQDALLGREMKLQEYDHHVNNYALWGYWKGAKWKFEYLGHPNLTRILVTTSPRGWLWYIPIDTDVVSIGFVTHRQTLKQMQGGPEKLYREEIAACPEIQELLEGASLVRIAPDQTRDVCAIQDWGYTNRKMSGPGWATAGDAAGFVDPILSSGTMLALELGQKAAYTINSSFTASSDKLIEAYWNFYDETYHTVLQAYREMARFWYSNNFSMESWWWNAHRLVSQQDSAVQLTSREAYTRLAFGYATRAESLCLFGSYPLEEAQHLVDGLFGQSFDKSATIAQYSHRSLQLRDDARLTHGLYYFGGQVRRTQRVVSGNKSYLDLHPAEEHVVHLLDGTHTLSDLDATVAQLRDQDIRRVRSSIELLTQLDTIGALV